METKTKDQYKTWGKSRSNRLSNYDYSKDRPIHVTICTESKNNIFDSAVNAQIVIDELLKTSKDLKFRILCYCLMPDHMHLLLSPPGDGMSVSQFIGGFKSKTTRIAWDYGIQGKLWQGRFYDHILRKKEKMNVIGEYILNNPVRKGMVDDWRKYKYCGIIDYWI